MRVLESVFASRLLSRALPIVHDRGDQPARFNEEPVDPGASKVGGPVHPDPAEGTNPFPLSWSPDGERLVMVTRNPPALWLLDVDSGAYRALELELERFGGGYWLSDEEFLVYSVDGGGTGLDPATGELRPIPGLASLEDVGLIGAGPGFVHAVDSQTRSDIWLLSPSSPNR